MGSGWTIRTGQSTLNRGSVQPVPAIATAGFVSRHEPTNFLGFIFLRLPPAPSWPSALRTRDSLVTAQSGLDTPRCFRRRRTSALAYHPAPATESLSSSSLRPCAALLFPPG